MGAKRKLPLATTKLLTSYVAQSKHHAALHLFAHLPSPFDSLALALALKSAAALRLASAVASLHAAALKSALTASPHLASSLVSSYAKTSSLEDAHHLFDQMPHRNAATWNALISLYCRANDVPTALQLFESMDVPPSASCFNSILAALAPTPSKAIEFYRKMAQKGLKPDLITLLALLPACIGLGELSLVREVHGFAVRNGIHLNSQFGSAVIEAYGRCGGLRSAQGVFDGMGERDVVVWSSLVSGYAFHGEADAALSVFERMGRGSVQPDSVMFLGVLKACSHAGRAEDALKYFEVMRRVYGVKAGSDHYSCLVDVLGRAGRLDEAYKVIKGMPVATAKAWGALLCACRSYGEIGLAEIAGRALFEIEPDNARNYVLLASTYAGVGKFQEAEKVRREMEEKQMAKSSGGSWVVSRKS